ncbi:MAG: hypothetical protein COB35_01215 [Gammaproteobacteria bacterium]|nr:MAG: hypothetical protein COB35_01215 [Gammaproteobacteria bacterium]
MTKATLVTNKKNNIDLLLEPIKAGLPLTESDIRDLVKDSKYADLFLDIVNVKNAIAELNSVLKPLQANKTGREIQYQILERRDATLTITIDKDEMSAIGEIQTAMGGKHLTAKTILNNAQSDGVKKGFSKKDLLELAKMAAKAPPGTTVEHPVAIGKEAVDGTDAKIKPLVQSAQDRLLRPKEREDGSVDMRDFGDLVCVKVGDPLAKKIPLTEGVKGFTVTGTPLEPTAGDDIELKVGDGTRISAKNENVLVSEKVGLPRFIDNGMEVDDVYSIDNVDVSSGNVKFEGSVLISGDVNEGMKVIASGDITIGGFVESALIEAGGDITISGGIIGRKQDVENTAVTDCQMSANIIAQGNVFAKYCQYAEIYSGGDLRIENQLMHSILNIDGQLWVGSEDKANGKFIGGYATVGKSAHAGIVGATAGSNTIVKFEKRIDEFKDLLVEIDERIKSEDKTSNELQNALNKMRKLPKNKQDSDLMTKIYNSYKSHTQELAKALESKQQIDEAMQSYMTTVCIEATEKLYQGVELIVGDFKDRSKREYGPSRMMYKERKIIIDPIVNT